MTTNKTGFTAKLVSKKWQTLLVIVLLVLVGIYANRLIQTHLGQQAIEQTGLKVLSLQQALDKAKLSNKLVLADMSAVWCPTCRKLDKQVFSDDRVKAQLKQDFVFTRIEYDSKEGEAFM
jgi:thiol:disulfide interchange protein